MAWLEQHPTSDRFKICFRWSGKRIKTTIKTTSRRDAESFLARFEENLSLLERGRLELPPGADISAFLLSDGKVVKGPKETRQESAAPAEPLPLQSVIDQYTSALGLSIEANSLATVKMHGRHLIRHFGATTKLEAISPAKLQEYVEVRAKKKGLLQKPLSPATIRKEITTLRAAWNWAAQMKIASIPFPDLTLKYPKAEEKPPFQTREEIDRKIATGITREEARDLWDCLFLSLDQIEQFLAHVKALPLQPFVYPMICFAAHTGARRSELLRLRKTDLDLNAGTVLIHEKKRVRGSRTSRLVPISPFLSNVVRDWLAQHPGGPTLFCQPTEVIRSRKDRHDCTPITRNEANDHFKRAVADSKWQVLRGWHVFRHSFASNCAAKCIDQRLIDAWLGHQTEEMRRRYRHCFPNQHREAISRVFG